MSKNNAFFPYKSILNQQVKLLVDVGVWEGPQGEICAGGSGQRKKILPGYIFRVGIPKTEQLTVDAFLQAGVQGLTNVGNKKLSLSEELLVIQWYLAGCCQRLDHCE